MGEMDFGKNNRVLSIYTKLMNGKIVNKKEEAVCFGVNERSIQRDIENIRDFLDNQVVEDGIRNQLIYDYKAKGYRLEQSEHVKMTNAEILAVSKILLDSRAFTKTEMMNILDKLLNSCVPKKNQKLISDLISNERFHYMELNHHTVFMDKLMDLGQAIRGERIISIQYARTKDGAIVERKLEPLAIMFSEYYFYLVGFIRDINKEEEFDNADDPFPTIYRIDRIKKLKVLDEYFKIPYANRFEEGEFRKRIQFMYGGKLQRVKFEYTGSSVEAVLDRLPTAKIVSETDGKYVIQAEVFGKGIDMWLRSQGESVRVL